MTAQRGAALISTLGIMLLLLPLGAYLVLQCRTDLIVQRSFREEIEAFYVAEAGLEHAVADISPGQSFDQVLAGPDHLAGTDDDGMFPFGEGVPSPFPSPPFHYDVRVARADANSLYLVSLGSGKNGATKTVAAMVSRSPLAWTPAAMYTQSDVGGIDLGGGGFLLSGFDHQINDAPDKPAGAAAPIPALGSSGPNTEQALRTTLGEEVARQLVGAGGSPSIATTASVDAQGAVSVLARRSDSVSLGSLTASEPTRFGTSAAPHISVVNGDLDIPGRADGNGILVVRGNLHVSGGFDFTGLVVVMGDVILDASSETVITGAFWHGAGMGGRLRLGGAGAMMYSSEALAAVDAAFPGALPHAAVVTGWLEQL